MTIRVRLAFLFTILFALAGAALLTINYVLVRDRLPAHHISTITANDVINRAGKLLNVQKVPADQQKILRAIATATPSQVSLLIRNHPDIPPGLAKLLFSELPNSTRADALHQLLVQSSIALAV